MEDWLANTKEAVKGDFVLLGKGEVMVFIIPFIILILVIGWGFSNYTEGYDKGYKEGLAAYCPDCPKYNPQSRPPNSSLKWL
jgi:hypothetical protein